MEKEPLYIDSFNYFLGRERRKMQILKIVQISLSMKREK
jgi:hypothetical protein